MEAGGRYAPFGNKGMRYFIPFLKRKLKYPSGDEMGCTAMKMWNFLTLSI